MLNKKYNSREEEARTELSFIEVVRRIKEVYGAEYDPERPNFDAWDQLLACESIAESTPIKYLYKDEANKNPSVSGMLNDSYSHGVIFELTQDKQKVIAELTHCNYRTPPIQIATLLEKFFKEWHSNQGHWLYVAQQWTPRAINRTIHRLTKLHIEGRITIRNPAAYFTKLIKFRKPRRI